jgi:GWxTD domain-containing protein
MALKKLFILPLVLFIASTLFSSQPALAQEAELSPKWKQWLNQYVVYIISERERDLFLQLKTEEQRLAFEKEFWLQRDPTPGTTRNEFQEEHQERFEYANKYLGRDSSKKGWQTDRGRYYIILGKPRQVQRMPSAGQVYPLELWFYQAPQDKGLPPFFNLIFFKRHGSGEYRLYSPVMDGPQALMTTQSNISNSKAYEALYYLNPELAQAAFSYTYDQTVSRGSIAPSLSSVSLIGKIENSRNLGVDPSYAERILLGTASVTTNYTFSNFIFPNLVFPMVRKEGYSVICYAFQVPTEMMNMGQNQQIVYGALEVETTLSSLEGLQIQKKTEKLDFEYSPEQFEKLKFSPIVFQDQLLCIPGEYSLSIRIRNPLTKEYFLISENVVVSGAKPQSPEVGRLLLAAGAEKTRSQYQAPFQFANYTLNVHPDGNFPVGAPLFLYSQILLPDGFRYAGKELKLTLSLLQKDGKEITSMSQPLLGKQADANGLLHVTVQFPMKLQPGKYIQALEVDFGPEFEKQLRTYSFQIVDKAPILNRRLGPSINPAGNLIARERGRIHFESGNFEIARELLLEAVAKDKNDLSSRLLLGKVLLELNNYQEIINLLQLSLTDSPDNVQILHLLGLASYHSGHFSKATKYLERFLKQQPDNVQVLNLLAESWSKLDNVVKAEGYWRQSLEIDADQGDIRRKLEGLK